MLQSYSDWIDLMKVFEEGKMQGVAQREKAVVICLVRRVNMETGKEEYLVVDGGSGEYLISGLVQNFEMGVQAARREILEKSGLVCVEKMDLILRKSAWELPGTGDLSGEFQVFSVEVSFLQSSLFENEDVKWVEACRLVEICRILNVARAELIYLALRKLGYDEEYFLNNLYA